MIDYKLEINLSKVETVVIIGYLFNFKKSIFITFIIIISIF